MPILNLNNYVEASVDVIMTKPKQGLETGNVLQVTNDSIDVDPGLN